MLQEKKKGEEKRKKRERERETKKVVKGDVKKRL